MKGSKGKGKIENDSKGLNDREGENGRERKE